MEEGGTGVRGFLKRTWEAAQQVVGQAWEYTPKGFGYAPLVEEAVKEEVAEPEAAPPSKKRKVYESDAPTTPSTNVKSPLRKTPAQSDITPDDTTLSTFTEDVSELQSPEPRKRKVRRLSKRHANHRAAVATAKELVRHLGGTFVKQLGIDLADGTPDSVDKWFLWALLFNHRISANIVFRTHEVLAQAGLERPQDASRFSQDEIAALLQKGGYTHYMQQTAKRLKQAAEQIKESAHQSVADLKEVEDPKELEREIEKLHGAGRSTATLFLRELRGIWPGAQPDYDDRVIRAAAHLELLDFEDEATRKKTNLGEVGGELAAQILGSPHPLEELAAKAGASIRDLEAALVRLSLVHSHHYKTCAGGPSCEGLIASVAENGNIVVGSPAIKKRGAKGAAKGAE